MQDTQEVKEGIGYQSGIDFSESHDDITTIPDAVMPPEAKQIIADDPNIVIFDLETTSIGNRLFMYLIKFMNS